MRGRLTARAALAQLLAGTGLSAVSDEKSGALTIVRGPVEGERNTAPPPAPDLPPPAKKKLTP